MADTHVANCRVCRTLKACLDASICEACNKLMVTHRNSLPRLVSRIDVLEVELKGANDRCNLALSQRTQWRARAVEAENRLVERDYPPLEIKKEQHPDVDPASVRGTPEWLTGQAVWADQEIDRMRERLSTLEAWSWRDLDQEVESDHETEVKRLRKLLGEAIDAVEDTTTHDRLKADLGPVHHKSEDTERRENG